MINQGNFYIYDNLDEFVKHGRAGRRAVLFIRDKKLIEHGELNGRRTIQFERLGSAFCLILNYQEFMEECRKEIIENSFVQICLIKNDFPEYEIEDANQLITYLLEKAKTIE